MKTFASKSSKSKYMVEGDAISDQRSGSPSSDYVVIEKSGEMSNGTVQKGIESIDESHRISPTGSSASMSSEANSTASGTTKVCILCS